MTEIPANTVTPEELALWYEMDQQLSKLKAQEMLLRMKIFKFYFPTPVEGTNTFSLPDGYALKGVHGINREIDIAAAKVLAEKFVEAKIAVDALIQWKPSLSIKEYRTLTAEQMHLFDQCLTIKPGAPALDIVLPKTKGKAGAKA